MEGNDFFAMAPEEGPVVDLNGLGVHFKVRGAQTGGRFAVVEHPVDPRIVVEPHRHQYEDEMSYVLAGTVWARVGDREVEAPAGSYVWKPRGVWHTFWNATDEPARVLEVITPAGFEDFFEHIAELLRDEQPDDERIGELCERHGIEFDRSWLPGIEERVGPLRMV